MLIKQKHLQHNISCLSFLHEYVGTRNISPGLWELDANCLAHPRSGSDGIEWVEWQRQK